MKRIISILTVVAVVLFAGYNVYKAQQREVLSDVAMANVEALAQGEITVLTPCFQVPDNYCIYLSTTSNEVIVIPGKFYE